MKGFVKLMTSDGKQIIVNPAAVLYVSEGDEVCTLHFGTGAVMAVRATLQQLQVTLSSGLDLE